MGKVFFGAGMIFLFVLGLGFVMYQSGQSQEKTGAAPGAVGKGKEPAVPAKPVEPPSQVVQHIRVLQEEIDVTPLHGKAKLPEALRVLSQVSGITGKELPIYVDQEAFKADNPDAPPVADVEVNLPDSVKKMSRAVAMRLILGQ